MTDTINNKKIFTELNEVCTAISKQLPKEVLLEKIITTTQSILNADGASLYIKHGDALRFNIVRNESLKMNLNESSEATKALPEIPLHPIKNQHTSVSAHCAANKKTINIQDISHEKSIDISPTKAFDAKFNYNTKSILAAPILDSHQEVLGVMQLINAKNPNQRFDQADVELFEAMTALLSLVLSRKN